LCCVILCSTLAEPSRKARSCRRSKPEYERQTGQPFLDPQRATHTLHQQGYLQKVSKGQYLYDSAQVNPRHDLEDFPVDVKEAVLQRDGYRCVFCGRGPEDGVELHVDHVKPKDQGGQATLENGQTLCAQHNFQKKNYDDVEFGKRYFIGRLQQAHAVNDSNMIAFCSAVLALYDQFDIATHIRSEPPGPDEA
jgi:hypothetical protein